MEIKSLILSELFSVRSTKTLSEVQKRALKAVDKIKEKTVGSPVLAVTHVAILRCLIIYFQKLDINLYRTIDIPNASVFRLRLDGDSGHITKT